MDMKTKRKIDHQKLLKEVEIKNFLSRIVKPRITRNIDIFTGCKTTYGRYEKISKITKNGQSFMNHTKSNKLSSGVNSSFSPSQSNTKINNQNEMVKIDKNHEELIYKGFSP